MNPQAQEIRDAPEPPELLVVVQPVRLEPALEKAAKELGVTYEEVRSAVDFGWVNGGTAA